MKKDLRFIYKYIKQYKLSIAVALSLIFIASLFDLTYGYFNGAAIEEITKLNLKMCFIYYMLYFGISVFSSVLLRKFGSYIMNKVQLKVVKKINNDVYLKTLNMPAIAFEEKKAGNL